MEDAPPPTPPSETEAKPDPAVTRLERRISRERAARQQAEALLEEKSRELFDTNQQLAALNNDLEDLVRQRTSELESALQSIQHAKAISEREALHDPLTRLPNRRYLRNKLDEMVAAAREQNRHLAILHIDLDRFKQINDTCGHAAGDHLLRHVSNVLGSVTTEQTFVARIGGDEFVMVAEFDGDLARIAGLGEAVVDQLSRPTRFEETLLRFGASVGIAFARGASVDAAKLLVQADLALYRAKENGRGIVEFFSADMEAELNHRKQTADGIQDALAEGAFFPLYQPRIAASNGLITCVEALVRWRHPTRGVLAPSAFMDIANDIGATPEIDAAVLRQATADWRRWRAAGLHVPKISVNVSAPRLLQKGLIERLDDADLPRGAVTFELLETVFFDDVETEVLSRLDALRDLGIMIELDDFGSGHSSIVALMKIQPATIKIDRRLVSGVCNDPASRRLVKAIVDIGAAVSATVVAEGVETMDHARICRDLGCAQLQGYAFSRPVDADALAAFAARVAQSDAAFWESAPEIDRSALAPCAPRIL